MYRITFALGGLEDRDLALAEIQILLDALQRADVIYLRGRPGSVPLLAAARVLLEDEVLPWTRLGDLGQVLSLSAGAPEAWQDIPVSMMVRRDGTRRAGNAALAAWRAAELEVQGIPAKAVVVPSSDRSSWRAVVQRGDGTVEDPSQGRGWTAVADGQGRKRISFVLDLFKGAEDEDLSHATLNVLLDALTAIDALYLERHPETPRLYESGIRYMEEPPGQEEWQDVPTSLRMGKADCEDVATWRAAELALRDGQDARPTFRRSKRWDGATLYHIVTLRQDGMVEDPSRALGMR